MNKIADEKIHKLPKWAQEYIRDIKRERETAVRALNEHLDNQTESPFYFEDLLCIGESKGPSFKKQYFQAYSMTVKYADVELRINLRDDCIKLSYGAYGHRLKDTAFIPESYQQARLVAKENMR